MLPFNKSSFSCINFLACSDAPCACFKAAWLEASTWACRVMSMTNLLKTTNMKREKPDIYMFLSARNNFMCACSSACGLFWRFTWRKEIRILILIIPMKFKEKRKADRHPLQVHQTNSRAVSLKLKDVATPFACGLGRRWKQVLPLLLSTLQGPDGSYWVTREQLRCTPHVLSARVQSSPTQKPEHTNAKEKVHGWARLLADVPGKFHAD